MMRALLALSLIVGATASCSQDTGGTCAVLGCRSSRNAECVEGKCMCSGAYCANYGTCSCESDTGGTCQFFGCASSRGPVDCIAGKCKCQPDYCSNDGKCESPNAAAKSANFTQELSDEVSREEASMPLVWAAFAGALGGFAAVPLVLFAMKWRREATASEQPLLEES
mmetsp:Transcript_129345/g.237840  ORF Transcript_129345/g.237840 Transcript_129345/m.237840 type:complete len:168 (+) Transcript_129345:44-547(+)